MEITGRLTADAAVATTRSGKQVVRFSIAINDSYRAKDSDELKQLTTYINCAYWRSPKPAQWLKKGALVQLYGRIGLNVYTNKEGNAIGALNFHVSDVKILAFPKNKQEGTAAATVYQAPKAGNTTTAEDDLPF